MRAHGIEIEMLTASAGYDNLSTVRDALRAAGVRAKVSGHGAEDYTVWQVQSDGSLPSDRGVEVVSPRLNDPSFDELRKVCGALASIGATVNKRCGLHVHFDARDLTVQQVCAIALAYDTALAEINELLPPSRRTDVNEWAVPAAGGLRGLPDIRPALAHGAAGGTLTSSQRRDVFGAPDLNTHYDPRRYRAVSLVRVLHARNPENRTIEFRAHSGTVDFEKIKNWVVILNNLIEATLSKLARVAGQPAPAPVAVPSSGAVPAHHIRANAPRIVRGGTKVRQFIERCQNGTATFEWCASELDWSRDTAQSWAAYVRAWGFPLKSIKMGRQVLGYTMETVATVTTRLELNASNAREILKHDIKAGLPGDVAKYVDDRKAALATAGRLAPALRNLRTGGR